MPNADWMGAFTDTLNLTLADLTLPASHDAGVSEAHHQRYTARIGPDKDTIAQYYDIAGQLGAGSRFFDLRIAPHGGVLKTFHGGNLGGQWGQRADLIFQEVDTFLTNHPGEIVILRISHTKASANVGACVTANINVARRYCVGQRNLALTPLRYMRGKAIVIFDDDALATATPNTGLHRFTKYSAGTPVGNGLTICGSYGGIWADLREMVQTAVRCGNTHGTHPRVGAHDHLFMIYWQLAFNIKQKTILGGAARQGMPLTRLDDNQGVHYNLDYILNAHRGLYAMHRVSFRAKKTLKISKTVETTNVTRLNRRWHRPNIINLDFVDDEVCSRIIAFNNYFLNNN